LPMPHNVFEVPATAIMNDSKGIRVAVVGEDQKIHLAPVEIERDTGATMEISSGIAAGDRVVKLGGVELTEGRSVDVVP